MSDDVGVAEEAPLDDIEALRRELLRSRRDNAQFQLKVKNLSHALEGVQGARHEADRAAIRSFIVENRASGPLVYEGVRLSVTSEPPVGHDTATEARGSAQKPARAAFSEAAEPPLDAAPRAARAATALPAAPLGAQSHFVVNSFAALDVSSRLASAQAGRRPNVRGSSRAAVVAAATGATPLSLGETHPRSSPLDDVVSAGSLSLPTPPRTIPPGVPPRKYPPAQQQQPPQGWIASDTSREGVDDVGSFDAIEAAATAAAAAASAAMVPEAGTDDDGSAPPRRGLDAAGDYDDEDEDEDDDDEPPPPPLGSPSTAADPSTDVPPAHASGEEYYFEPFDTSVPLMPESAGRPFLQPFEQQLPQRRRHSLPAVSEASPTDTTRLQGLVIGLQSELEDLRAQFSTTVEQARVDGGEMAAAEVGGFYEDVVARHAAALEAEAARRLREEARANAAAAEVAAMREELELLRSRTAAASQAKAQSPPSRASADPKSPGETSGATVSPDTAARLPATPAGSSGFSTGGTSAGGRRGSAAREEVEYLRLHYENELAVAAKKAAESQAYAVAAVRSVLQAQLDDLNAIFEVQLAEGKKEAALAAARDARAENADVERRVAAAVADAVSAAQQEADRQRVEAVRAALALAAGDFKSQLTAALATLRENLLAEKAALRESLEQEKQREIEVHVAAARSEYEAVMNQYEQSTESWRRDTVAACERSLDAARLQVAEARAQAQAQAAEAEQLRKELQRVSALAALRVPASAQPDPQPAKTAEDGADTQLPTGLPPAIERARAGSTVGSSDAPGAASGSASARGTAPTSTAPAVIPSALPVASPRNVAAAKAYAAALAAEGHPVSAASLLAGAAARATEQSARAAGAANPPPSTAAPTSAAASAAGAGSDKSVDRRDSDVAGDDVAPEVSTAESGIPACPPGVTQRLYTTILHMSVSALKGMLTRAGIPHGDCREKNDLRERLLQAVEKGQSLSPTAGPRPSHGFTAGLGAAPVAARERGPAAATATGDSASTAVGSSSRRPSAGPTASEVPLDVRLQAAATARSASGTSTGEAATARSERSASFDGASGNGPTGLPAAVGPSAATPQQHRPSVAMAAAGHPEAAKAPSPQELKNWLPARAPDGAVYYYHRVSRAVRWDKPEAEIARKMEARILGEDAAVKARQAERLAGLAADQENAKIAAAQRARIESEVDARVKLWSRGKGIRQLLTSLHTILTSRSVPDYVAGGASASSNAEELKKTYHKAIRLVHPDKVAPTATLEAQIEAQKIFAVLSEAYKKYADAEGAGVAGAGLSSFTSAAQSSRRPTGGSSADMPSFGSFGAGSSGISGAAARARAAFNAMHSATRGPSATASSAGGAATSGGPGVGGGVRFTSFSAHTGYHASGAGSAGWAGGTAGGSATSR